MNDHVHHVPCALCGQTVLESTPVCSHDVDLPPVCLDCVQEVLPQALVRGVLEQGTGGCSYGRLQAGLEGIERAYWKAAAEHLHHAADAFAAAQDEDLDDEDDEDPFDDLDDRPLMGQPVAGFGPCP